MKFKNTWYIYYIIKTSIYRPIHFLMLWIYSEVIGIGLHIFSTRVCINNNFGVATTISWKAFCYKQYLTYLYLLLHNLHGHAYNEYVYGTTGKVYLCGLNVLRYCSNNIIIIIIILLKHNFLRTPRNRCSTTVNTWITQHILHTIDLVILGLESAMIYR